MVIFKNIHLFLTNAMIFCIKLQKRHIFIKSTPFFILIKEFRLKEKVTNPSCKFIL